VGKEAAAQDTVIRFSDHPWHDRQQIQKKKTGRRACEHHYFFHQYFNFPFRKVVPLPRPFVTGLSEKIHQTGKSDKYVLNNDGQTPLDPDDPVCRQRVKIACSICRTAAPDPIFLDIIKMIYAV
jgi:hypothetical protein